MERWQQDLIEHESSRYLADIERKKEELARFLYDEIPMTEATPGTHGWANYWKCRCPHCNIPATHMGLPSLHKCGLCEKWYFVKEEEK